MQWKYHRPPSLAAYWALFLGRLSLLLLAFIVILHYLEFLKTTYFWIFVFIVAFIAFIALFLSLKAFFVLWKYGYKGGFAAIKGAVFALITLFPLLLAGLAFIFLPPIYEVLTDFDSPPVFLEGSRPRDVFPVASDVMPLEESQTAIWPRLRGRHYSASMDAILKAVLAVIGKQNWQIVEQRGGTDDDEVLIQAVAKTTFVGFVSDVVLRLTDEGNLTFVDIRAASRYLHRDFGINARLVMDFMEALDKEVLLVPAEKLQE